MATQPSSDRRTVADARQEALDYGIPESDHTPEVLRRFGARVDYAIIPEDWTPKPVQDKEQMRGLLAIAAQEIQENEGLADLGEILSRLGNRILDVVL